MIKGQKRRAYEERIGRSALRKQWRENPDNKAKEKVLRDRYRAKPEIRAKHIAYKAKYNALPSTRVMTILNATRLRAAKKGLPFDLDEGWIAQRVLGRGVCEVTGLPFDFEKPINGWSKNPNTPSVDQIVAGAGYLKSNCRVVATWLNIALAEWGEDAFADRAADFLRARGCEVKPKR